MSEPRPLRNAPITEAIFDWRVKARAGLSAEEFKDLKERLQDQFPKMHESRSYEAMVQLGPKGQAEALSRDLGLRGYHFKSADETQIVQFRTDGFTFNRLRPYTSFDSLFPIAQQLWQVYCELARPEFVTRLALRYLNRVPLPPSLRDFDDYLRGAPVIPPELPQHVSGFFSRVTIHDPDKGFAAHVAQALETDFATRTITVILDIDAYKEQQYPVDDPAIVETFHELRVFKNRVFFSSLTDEALRQFE